MVRIVSRAMVISCCLVAAATAQQSESEPSSPATTPEGRDDLSVDQAQLADRWDRLEQIAARLAELSASSDPVRAELLRKAIAQAREQEVHLRFEAIVDLLEQERYTIATKNQETLEGELQQLLELLLKENRAEELRSQQAWLRMQLKEVNRIILLQRGVKARTEGGDDTDRLAEDQERIQERTGGLAEKIEQAQGGSRQGGQEQGNQNASPSADRASEASEDQADDENGDSPDAANGEDEINPPPSGDEQAPSSEGNSSNSREADPSKGDPQESAPSGDNSEAQPSDQNQEGQQSEQSPSGGQPGQQGSGESTPGGEGDNNDPPPASSDPDENLRRRLRAAQENMERARQELEEAERSGATQEQERALRELEEAKAELERILRQLREEEMERTLTLLEARFRRMLELQIGVYEGTVRLDRVPQEARDHDVEIEAGRLSRQEESIVNEADKALELLLEEGSSVAFPESVTQMRGDMQDVAELLSQMRVDEFTQGIEEDIIAQLEETIEALQNALEDLEKNKTPPGQSPPPGEPQDPPLVDMLEEVKMIRALQMRINRRTQRYSEMIGGGRTEDPQLLDALQQLAVRQERVYDATRDLHLGKNR